MLTERPDQNLRIDGKPGLETGPADRTPAVDAGDEAHVETRVVERLHADAEAVGAAGALLNRGSLPPAASPGNTYFRFNERAHDGLIAALLETRLSKKLLAEVSAPASSSGTFTSEISLRNGARMRMRSMVPGDQPGVLAMLGRCSRETLRYRFLRMVKEVTSDLAGQVPPADGERQVALVVGPIEKGDDRIVAVGRYIVEDRRPEVAEVSFLVEDALQRQGIGTMLLDALAELALRHGVRRFSADVLSDNWLMLSVFRDAGYRLHSDTSCGVTHVEFSIPSGRRAPIS
jgi:GNAT superfamily N-acetyltransferase